MKDHDERLAWWRDARFGMFIHWGVYSRAGGEWKGHKVEGYAEHLMRKEKISRAEYLELAHGFNPIKFNADEWVRHAKQAGMRYMIITSKHHDGFAMYDSQVSDFNVMKQTAWKKDPMAALSAACKKYGVKFGFYYSHAFDWEHPDAPGNDWEYNNPVTGDWEAIPTTNESYGYHKFDSSHKPVAHFIQLLAKSASRGGNLLMNIGPKGDGTFDAKDLHILQGIGKWMDINGGSIRGSSAGPLPLQNWGVSTLKGNTLFLHVFSWPSDGKLWVGGLKGAIGKVFLLSDARRALLASSPAGEDLVIDVPRRAPDTADAVIAVELKEGGAFDSVQFVAPNIALTRLLAFDARLHGNGFSFGDGKRDRFYVDGWNSKDQYLSWGFRTVAAGDYHMTIMYRAGEGYGGTYRWHVDGIQGEQKIATGGSDDVVTVDLGMVSLGAGTHELSIRPVDITGGMLMRPLELRLVK
jgi:hypothetical protein